MENSTITVEQPKEKPWILNLIGLLFFAGLAWWSYSKITSFETGGGILSLPKPLKLFYDLVGKWGVVGFWLAFVAYNLVKGIIVIIKGNK